MNQPKSSPYRWAIEAVLLPLQIAAGLNVFAPAPLFPLIVEDYGLGKGVLSLLVVAVTLVLTAFLIPGGLIVARLGLRKAIAVSGFLMAAGTLAMVAPNFWVLLVLRVAFGVGIGILLPATTAVAVQWFRLGERPLINGANLTGQSSGVAIAMFFGVPIAEALGGWQATLSVYGAFALLGAIVWLFVSRTPPSEAGPVANPSMRDVLDIIKDKNVFVASVAAVGPFAVFVAFTSWLPTYYHEAFGMPLVRASSLVAILPLMGVVFNLIGGIVLAKLGLRKPILFLIGVLFPLAALGTFLFDNPVIIVGSIMLLGVCFWLFLPTIFTISMELPGISLEKIAVVTAVVLLLGNLATVFSPLFVGITVDALGSYMPSLWVLAFFPVTLLISALFLPETGPKASRRRLLTSASEPESTPGDTPP